MVGYPRLETPTMMMYAFRFFHKQRPVTIANNALEPYDSKGHLV